MTLYNALKSSTTTNKNKTKGLFTYHVVCNDVVIFVVVGHSIAIFIHSEIFVIDFMNLRFFSCQTMKMA